MSGEASRREDELRQHVAKLKRELEAERNAKKELQRGRVRDVQAAKEKEQVTAREQLEAVKLKLAKEKTQELQSLRDSLTKEIKSKLKVMESKHKDEMSAVQSQWKSEVQQLKQKYRAEMLEQAKAELDASFEQERKRMTHSMFELEARRKAAEDKMADTVASDKTKAERIREIDTQHKTEVERLQRAARTSSRQQMEELEEAKRRLIEKDRELGQQSERLSRLQADKDHLEEEVGRLRKAESWARASPRAISPTLSPSTSTEELAQHYTKRERDTLIRNSELTFTVRRLEEVNAQLKRENQELQQRASDAESSQRQLKEKNHKLSQRMNDANVTLRSREKQFKQLSQENLELKTKYQQLEEEHSRHKKTLKEQLSKSSTYRSERERLLSKNKQLSSSNTSLMSRLDQLEQLNTSLQERVSSPVPSSPLPPSPYPLSPIPIWNGDDEIAGSQVSLLSESSTMQDQIDQLEFEKEETKSKYDEVKSEYVDLRRKYREVTDKYQRLQERAKQQVSATRQVQSDCEQLHMEKLDLEKEVSFLRSMVGEEGWDQARTKTHYESLQEKLAESDDTVTKLENFIIEQDEVMRTQEARFLDEKLQLVAENHELQERVEALNAPTGETEQVDGWSDDLQVLTSRVSELEDSNAALRRELEEARGEQERVRDYEEVQRQLKEATESVRLLKAEVTNVKRVNASLEERLEEVLGAPTGGTERVDGGGRDDLQVLTSRVSELEDSNAALRRELAVVREEQERVRDYEEVQRQLKEATESIRLLKAEVAGVKAVKASLEEQLIVTEEELRSVQEQVKGLQSSELQLSQQLRLQKAESEGLKQQVSPTKSASGQASVLKAYTMSTELQSLLQEEQVSPEGRQQAISLCGELVTVLTESVRSEGDRNTSFSEDDMDFGEPGVRSPIPAHRLQQWVEEKRRQTSNLMEENNDLHSRLTAAMEMVSEMRGTVEQLESQLHEEQDTHTTMIMEKEDEVAQLRSEVSQMERKVTRMKRAVSVGVSQQMSKQMGQDILTSLRKVQEAPDRKAKARELQTLEVAVNELLHTVYPGTFEQQPPVSLSMDEEEEMEILEEGEPPLPPSSALPDEEEVLEEEDMEQGAVAAEEEAEDHGPTIEEKPQENVQRLFLVVMDYDPQSLCTTGQPELELSVPTGAVIAVHGQMDKNAHYTATFEGKTGLVPASFVQEIEIESQKSQQRLLNQTLPRSITPSSAVSRTGTPRTPQLSMLTSTPQPSPSSIAVTTAPPPPPSNLRVEKVLGNSVLLLSWQPPNLDSSGIQVTSYQLTVNGEGKNTASGTTNKALLAGLDLTQSLCLGIAAVSQSGVRSEVVTVNYPGLLPQVTATAEPEAARTFVALYDYNPATCSPSDNPEFELAFKEGNLVRVLGQEMEDGFLVGELGGRRGLVPAAFLTEVTGSMAIGDKNLRSSLLVDATLPGTSKSMVAAYDYDPHSDSPNDNPELELSFKAGDALTVYGNIDNDGFYCGEREGKFGLVPSNFLKATEENREEEASGEREGEAKTEEEEEKEEERETSSPPAAVDQELSSSLPRSLTPVGQQSQEVEVIQGSTESSVSSGDRDKGKGKRKRKGISLGKKWVKNAFSRNRSETH